MADYSTTLTCPACGTRDLNLLDYASLMVLRSDLGMFTMKCPSCGAKASSIQPIPKELEDEVRSAALRAHAGMGK